MDREQIQEQIDATKLLIANYTKNLEILRKQLEAEKPKLRHGDYGLDGGSKLLPFVVIGDDVYWLRKGEKPSIASFRPEEFTGKLGNLVDDLKDMSKDLEEFEFDVHEYYIDSKPEMAHAPIYIAGNWHPLNEAIEFHRKLGQLIATAIRKGKE